MNQSPPAPEKQDDGLLAILGEYEIAIEKGTVKRIPRQVLRLDQRVPTIKKAKP